MVVNTAGGGGSAAGVTGTAASCNYTAFASADYALADVIQFTTQCTAGVKASIVWVPEPAVSTWKGSCPGYVENPDPTTTISADNVAVTTQMHLSGTSHAVAFGGTPTVGIAATKVAGETLTGYATTPEDGRTTFHITVASVSNSAAAKAAAAINAARSAGGPALEAAHQKWWHEYYPMSFLTFSASRLESFYWIQMYKLASATRSDRVVYDLMGPWFIDGTNWPDLHWDLNVQLTYWSA